MSRRKHVIAAEIEDVEQRTLISAHTHVQVDRQVRLRRREESDVYAHPHEGDTNRQRQWQTLASGT